VPARTICERLMARGILTKETHHTVVRFAPPLVITSSQIDLAVDALRDILRDVEEEIGLTLVESA
jgi:ornithine--oxo-acid transaminase